MAWKKADYRSSKALDKANNPVIMAAVEAKRLEFMALEAMPLSIDAIRDTLQPTANPKLRADMAKWVQDRWRDEHASMATGGKDPSEMTPDELAAQLRDLEILLAAKAVDVTPAEDDSGLFD